MIFGYNIYKQFAVGNSAVGMIAVTVHVSQVQLVVLAACRPLSVLVTSPPAYSLLAARCLQVEVSTVDGDACTSNSHLTILQWELVVHNQALD
jgi:hypothetical protein